MNYQWPPKKLPPTEELLKIRSRMSASDAEEFDLLLQAQLIERARGSLAEFVRLSWEVLEQDTPLEWHWHIDAIANHVQWMIEGWAGERKQVVQNLIINVPPGSLKSRIVSVCAPAWAWLRWPGARFLCMSANPDVARRDATFSRDLIQSHWYQSWFKPKWSMRTDMDAISSFGNTRGGTRNSKGLNAKIVGQRGDIQLIDDPNDPKTAHSETERTKVNTNYASSGFNRVTDSRRSPRIVIQQRTHEMDMTGFLRARGGWELLRIPMEFEAARRCTTKFGWQDPRTQDGEVLHPERNTPEVLEADLRALGSYGYAGQLNQNPAPAEGGMFKRASWRFWRHPGVHTLYRPDKSDTAPGVLLPKRLDWTVLSVDATFGGKEGRKGGSKVSMIVVGGYQADRYVLDNVTRKMGFDETCEAIRTIRHKYEFDKILIENKANGPAIMNHLKKEIPRIIPVEPEGGKEARAWAIQPYVEAGNIYLPEGAEWLDDFITELSAFPRGANDDQVDALSQALIHMAETSDMFHAIAMSQM